MTSELDKLSDRELEVLLKAPVLVCILVAGADGKIDKKELRKAVSVARSRAKTQADLSAFYTLASADFEDKVRVLLQNYPKDAASRNAIVETELQELNEILPRLSTSFHKGYYDLLRDLAQTIATSSGGWLGYNAIAEEEARYVELAMISRPE